MTSHTRRVLELGVGLGLAMTLAMAKPMVGWILQWA